MVFGNTLHGLDLLTFLAGDIPAPAVVGTSQGEPNRWTMALTGVSSRGVVAAFNSTWDSPGRWRLSFTTPGKRYLFAPLETCQVFETGVNEPRAIEPEPCDRDFKPGFHGTGPGVSRRDRDRHSSGRAWPRRGRPGHAARRQVDAGLSNGREKRQE